MAINLSKAKESIKKELNNTVFNADSVGKIEGTIAELEAAKIKWREDPEIANLHERYIAKFSTLSEEMKKNLSSQITTARNRQEALRSEVSGIEIPAFVLSNPELMKQLQKLGVVKGDKAVFENARVAEKITKYLGYLNFIHDTQRDGRNAIVDMKTLVDNYLDVTNEGTDWILDKRFLQYKYIDAIYNDVIRRRYVMEKDSTTGEYNIVCPKVVTDPATGKQGIKRIKLQVAFPNHEYLRVLESANTRNMIDVAIVSSIMSKNFALDSQPVVGQKSMIAKLLEQHIIKSPRTGKTIQKAELALLDWKNAIPPHKSVQQQVNEKLTAATKPDDEVSTQSYQELLYIKNFIEREEYLQTDYNKTIFTEANIYRKGFLKEKALIDAYGGGDINNMTEKSVGDMIKSISGDAKGPLVILGIIALFFEKFRGLGFGMLGVGLLGPSVGDMVNSVTNEAKNALFSPEELELIMPYEVIPALKNTEHQKQFEKLAGINSKNLEALVDDKGRALPYLGNNFIMAHILNDLGEGKKMNDIDFASPTVATDLFSELRNPTFSSTDFSNYHEAPYTVTQADVNMFVELMKTPNFVEDDDETLADIFTSGIDIRNDDYKKIDFTIDENFDKAFNDHLRVRWGVNNDVNARNTLKKLGETIETSVSAGIIDNKIDALLNRNTDDVFRSLPEKLSNIDDLIAAIQTMVKPAGSIGPNDISSATANPLKATLEKYKIFLKADAEMSKYDGKLTSGKTFAEDTFKSITTSIDGGIFSSTGINEIEAERDKLTNKITKITPTTFEINGTATNISVNPLFNNIEERANNQIDKIQESVDKLNTIIKTRKQAQKDALLGVSTLPAITHLGASFPVGGNEFNQASQDIMEAHRGFNDKVAQFERDGKIDLIFTADTQQELNLLREANTVLVAMRLPGAPTDPLTKTWLREQTKTIFTTGGAEEKFKTKATTVFTEYFKENKKIDADINRIGSTFSTISTFLGHLDTVEDKQDLLLSRIGLTRTAIAGFIAGTESTATERSYILAQSGEIFGPSFNVPDDSTTAKAVLTKIDTKREELEEGLQTYINSNTTYTVAVLENFLEIERRGALDKISDSQTKKDYASMVEKIGKKIIDSIPSSPSGITQLKQIENLLDFNKPQGVYQKVVEAIMGSSTLKANFETKVAGVGSTILDSFNPDLAGLGKIIAFKSSGDYLWISPRITNFEDSYDAKLQSIRDTIKGTVDVSSITILASTVSAVASSVTSTSHKIALGNYSTSGKISGLITLMGITNTAPSGAHAGYKEAERKTIYDTLVTLKIL